MEQININYGGQDSQSRASSVIPANYDDLQDQLQAALTRIAVLEGNLQEECQAWQQAEAKFVFESNLADWLAALVLPQQT